MAAGAGDARTGLYVVAGGGGGPGGGVQATGGADSSVLGLHEHHSLHGRAGCLHTRHLSSGADCRGVQSLFRVKPLPMSPGFCDIFSACQWKYSCGWMCSAGRPSFVVHWSLEVSLLCATVDYAPLPLQTGGSLPGWCDTALVVV